MVTLLYIKMLNNFIGVYEMNENIKDYDDWMNNHITKHTFSFENEEELNLFTCWDETGANSIRTSSCLQEVVTALKSYSESLK